LNWHTRFGCASYSHLRAQVKLLPDVRRSLATKAPKASLKVASLASRSTVSTCRLMTGPPWRWVSHLCSVVMWAIVPRQLAVRTGSLVSVVRALGITGWPRSCRAAYQTRAHVPLDGDLVTGTPIGKGQCAESLDTARRPPRRNAGVRCCIGPNGNATMSSNQMLAPRE
jgi:hypothetical protein